MGIVPNPGSIVLVWYDFICPFCYVGQRRSRILAEAGLVVTELPVQAHPEIPVEGVTVGPRSGPMYEFLEREAAAEGLRLNWPSRLPNSRLALTAAEWVRRNQPDKFAALHESLFEAHFANREDIGDPEVVDQHLSALAIDPQPFWEAMEDGSAEQAIAEAETAGRAAGVSGTPAWLIGPQLIDGLRPISEFRRLAEAQQQAAV